MTADLSDYIDLLEAARLLGIHPESLRRLIKHGQVPHHFFAGKYLFHRLDFLQFKAGYQIRPGRKPSGRLL